jgi:hypothetical protein
MAANTLYVIYLWSPYRSKWEQKGYAIGDTNAAKFRNVFAKNPQGDSSLKYWSVQPSAYQPASKFNINSSGYYAIYSDRAHRVMVGSAKYMMNVFIAQWWQKVYGYAATFDPQGPMPSTPLEARWI